MVGTTDNGIMAESRVPLFQSFYRSQIGSFMATIVDVTTLYLLTEFLNVYYVISAGIASGLGAVVGFTVLRIWAFKQTDKPIAAQAIKYAMVSLLILILNMGGIYIVTEHLGLQYMISKLVIAFFIGIGVSFPLFRYYVYS